MRSTIHIKLISHMYSTIRGGADRPRARVHKKGHIDGGGLLKHFISVSVLGSIVLVPDLLV